MKAISLMLFLILMGYNTSENPQQNNREIEQNSIEIPRDETMDKSSETPDTIPNWIKELHELKENFPNYILSQTVIDYNALNDSVTWIIIDQNTGVCNKKYLVTHLKNKEINRAEIETECDHDLSYPKYAWKKFKFNEKNKLIVYEFIESVHDTLINSKGMLKMGFDYDDLEKQIDSVSVNLTIGLKGRITRE